MPIVILRVKSARVNSDFAGNTYLFGREGWLLLFERSISLS